MIRRHGPYRHQGEGDERKTGEESGRREEGIGRHTNLVGDLLLLTSRFRVSRAQSTAGAESTREREETVHLRCGGRRRVEPSRSSSFVKGSKMKCSLFAQQQEDYVVHSKALATRQNTANGSHLWAGGAAVGPKSEGSTVKSPGAGSGT